MSRLAFRIHMLTIIVAASYITLGIADTRAAENLWAPYAVVTLVLALLNVVMEGRRV